MNNYNHVLWIINKPNTGQKGQKGQKGHTPNHQSSVKSKLNLQVHYIAKRYAYYTSSIEILNHSPYNDSLIIDTLKRLRLAVEQSLMNHSKKFSTNKLSCIYLINNYHAIVSIIQQEYDAVGLFFASSNLSETTASTASKVATALPAKNTTKKINYF